jgi:hypothetical protein
MTKEIFSMFYIAIQFVSNEIVVVKPVFFWGKPESICMTANKRKGA